MPVGETMGRVANALAGLGCTLTCTIQSERADCAWTGVRGMPVCGVTGGNYSSCCGWVGLRVGAGLLVVEGVTAARGAAAGVSTALGMHGQCSLAHGPDRCASERRRMWIGGVLCTSFDAYYVAVLAALVCVCVSASNPNWWRWRMPPSAGKVVRHQAEGWTRLRGRACPLLRQGVYATILPSGRWRRSLLQLTQSSWRPQRARCANVWPRTRLSARYTSPAVMLMTT